MNPEPLGMRKITDVLRIETWLILALFVRMFLLIFGFKQIAAALFIIIHVLALMLGIKYVIRMFANKQKNENIPMLIIFVVMTVYIGALYLINRLTPMSLEELPVTLLIVCLLVAASDGCAVSKTIFKLYFKFSMIASIVLIISAMIPAFYKEGSLILYTANENQAGVIYMCMFMNMLVYLQMKKRFSISYFMVLFIAIGVFLGCVMTQSRTSIICCVLTVLVYSIFKRKTKPFSAFVIMVIMAIFVFFPFITANILPRAGIDISVITSGRNNIWETVINSAFANPFNANFTVPILSESILYGQAINAHNVLLELIWRYSLPVGLFFIIFMHMMLSKTNKLVGRNRLSIMLFATFAICLVHMCFEASLISGALDFSLYIVLPLVMGFNLEWNKGNKKIELKKGNEDE